MSSDFEALHEKLCAECGSGGTESVSRLIRQYGLDVNKTNSRGWAPIHFAARFGHVGTIHTLIQFAADQSKQNAEGKTPLELATFWGHEEVASILKESQKESPLLFQQNVVHFFSGNSLNRSGNQRKQKDWATKLMTDMSTTYIVFSGSKCLFQKGSQIVLLHYKYKDIQTYIEQGAIHIFLGVNEKQEAFFAIDISSISSNIEDIEKAFEKENQSFMSIRPTAFSMTNQLEVSLIAQARSVLDWNMRHKFCSICGNPTTIDEGGYKRVCSNETCLSHSSIQNISHPRTDPVVIAAVLSKDHRRCLLGRSKNFPPGMFSCLAGFIEPGESIEEAIKREVVEESNIKIGNVIYHSSQPWPFPSQLMIGCWAEAISEEIVIDKDELEEAKWFTKDEVMKGLSAPFDLSNSNLKIPPKYAIAHHLLLSWVEGKVPQQLAKI